MCWVGLYRMWGGGAGLGATGAVGFCCRNTIRKSWWKLWKKKTFISISYLGSLCLCRRPGWQQLWCPGLRPWCWAPQRSTWDGRGGSRPSSCWHQWTQSKLRLRMCCRRAREHEVFMVININIYVLQITSVLSNQTKILYLRKQRYW